MQLNPDLLGLTGMILVFASFIVKDWRWLYSFNMTGAALLAAYAYILDNKVFLAVETGIVAFLAYRLAGEIRGRRGSTRCRCS